ncbi:DUF6476 family protein [Cognatishimia maritima]|uniref:Uncharacterized protein n=1 Tax=Cognatishimia maritima TaxID=870908 RepID=A0A1M5V181_9RHOB|nr:DUF6476 family protein [Cognatishimia maritima]SHH68979.1 hypothetical protein SAMN04488044_3040 [Cognatishimia maritima]
MPTSPEQDAPEPELPANLQFLRRLITVLTAVMIGGLVVVVALLVTRFYGDGPEMPESISLPDGTEATAFTKGEGWYAVVTKDNTILIFDAMTGQLKQTIAIE